MSICPKCNNEIPEGAHACPACGEAPNASASPEVQDAAEIPAVFEFKADEPLPNVPSPVYAPVAERAGAEITAGSADAVRADISTGIVDAVRAAGRSPVFLVAALLYTGTIALGAIAYFSSLNLVSGLFDALDIGAYSIMSYLSAVSITTGYLFALSPQLLICIGLWMFYAACAEGGPRIKTTGLTLVKSGVIIYLVLVCLAAAVVFIAGLVLLLVWIGTQSYVPVEAVVVVAAVFGIIMILLALVISYYAAILRIIGVVRRACLSGQPQKRVTAFVPVVNIIVAAFGLISAALTFALPSMIYRLVSDIPDLDYYLGEYLPDALFASTGVNMVSLLSGLCSAGFLIAVSIGIFMYKNSVRSNPYNRR